MVVALEAIKEMLRDLTGSADQLHHVPVLKGTYLACIIYVVYARNTSVLKAMLAKQAWFAVLVLPGLFARGIVKAVDKDPAAV